MGRTIHRDEIIYIFTKLFDKNKFSRDGSNMFCKKGRSEVFMNMNQVVKLLLGLILLCSACREESRKENPVLLLTNPVDRFRADEPFEISREQLPHPDGDTTLWPVLRQADRRFVPTQIEYSPGDTTWQKLLFVYDFKPNDSVRLTVDWVLPSRYPRFPRRTNIRFAGEAVVGDSIVEWTTGSHDYNLAEWQESPPIQYRSVMWENDKMGFRHHFIGKNTRGVFGKRTKRMVLDSVGLTSDGRLDDRPVRPSWWGGDILFIGHSTGLGGLALQLPDNRLVRLGVRSAQPVDNVDSTVFTLLSEGPVRSVFRLDFYGWRLNDTLQMNLSQTVTIWAGQYGYDNRVTLFGQPEGSRLMTGIPTYMLKRNPVVKIYEGGYTSAMTFDMQSRDRQNYLGMAIVVPDRNFDKAFPVPARPGEDIQKQCSLLLKSDENDEVRYSVFAVWDAVDEDFASAEYFERFIRDRIRYLERPIRLSVIDPNQPADTLTLSGR